ncbi:MAG TPA: phage tail sheath subtilisin-like domain-containing protein, partial [Vicinamibacterales bacterium]|nr:phage tail sheath subtilisin-like domain-containing protein [Vicinamibacterales bacterium]
MPEYVSPGIYVDELPGGPRPIAGVPTSTAAILGETQRGPAYPTLVTSYAEYTRWFGSVVGPDRYVPDAVSGFFDNGGQRLYVARIAGAGATTAARTIGALTFCAAGTGLWGNRVWLRVLPSSLDADGDPIGFKLRLAYWSDPHPPDFDPFELANRNERPWPQHLEEFDDLSVDPQSPNYIAKRLTDPTTNRSISTLVRVAPIAPGALSLPATTGGDFLENGSDGVLPPSVVDYEGGIDEGVGRREPQGLAALTRDEYRDVALVYAPFPRNDPSNTIVKRLVAHCEEHRFRFAVIDSPNVDPMTLHPRDAATGIADTQYAAYYAPWIVVADPLTGTRVNVPPGGRVLGIYARTDVERGVHKAPANEVVRGALDVAFAVDEDSSSDLNRRGVNVIRAFPSRGIRVWGARTLSANGEWKYVSVRRLFALVERSIQEGTRWVIFEPNDERLWTRVRDTVRQFLRAQWTSGALTGRTENEAFFITCDRTTMTADDILNGRLVVEIGIAPVR